MTGKTTPRQLGPDQPPNVLRVIGVAAIFPLRLALYHAFPSPPSRPVAAVILPSHSRKGYETSRAGCGARPDRRTRPVVHTNERQPKEHHDSH
ncbi:MAG: hypothetical protein ACRDMH_01325 [Solirubrobacterales bacterium]